MFSPFIESWDWIKSHNPSSHLKKKHLNFITIHCEFPVECGATLISCSINADLLASYNRSLHNVPRHNRIYTHLPGQEYEVHRRFVYE